MSKTDVARELPAAGADSVTALLLSLRDGDQGAWDRLAPLVYDGLRAIAHRRLAREGERRPFDTTALVHETFLKLVDQERVQWKDRAQFYAIAAEAMRRILINAAHRRNAEKRGGGRRRVSLDRVEVGAMSRERAVELIALDRALRRLEARDARQHKVVEYRYFGGLTVEETAAALDVSPATVKRDWRMARAWLYGEIGGDVDAGAASALP